MGGCDVLDDGQPESGAPGGPMTGRVHAVEPLEDAVDLGRRDADALVGDRDVDGAGVAACRDQHRRLGAGVGDSVGDEVADGDHDLFGVAEDLQAGLARGDDGDVLGAGVDRTGVDRGGDHLVDGERPRCVEGVVALQPGELDDLLHQAGQPVALGEHAAGEPLDRLGVLRGLLDGLGEQPDRSHGSLQLVAHVGHEVTTDRLDPAFAGAVLHQREHQPGSEGGHPGGDVARRQSGSPRHHQLGLTDLPVAPHLRDDPGQLLVDHLAAPHQSQRVRRSRRLQHDVVLVHQHRAAAQDRQDGRHAGGYGGRGSRGQLVLLAVADVPREHGSTTDDGAEKGSQKCLRRRVHTAIVRSDSPAVRRCGAPGDDVHSQFTGSPRLVTWTLYVRPHA
ncbi:hypothetical protein NOCA2270089 [metagenome]|uniref:Uncharacterized protein n=1 Tax=metagenome TaxID=256318 RepID=A0A2P2C0E2_9ZZZZ